MTLSDETIEKMRAVGRSSLLRHSRLLVSLHTLERAHVPALDALA